MVDAAAYSCRPSHATMDAHTWRQPSRRRSGTNKIADLCEQWYVIESSFATPSSCAGFQKKKKKKPFPWIFFNLISAGDFTVNVFLCGCVFEPSVCANRCGLGCIYNFLSSFNGRVPNAANKKRTARRKLPDEIERVGTFVALEKRELVRRRFFV